MDSDLILSASRLDGRPDDTLFLLMTVIGLVNSRPVSVSVFLCKYVNSRGSNGYLGPEHQIHSLNLFNIPVSDSSSGKAGALSCDSIEELDTRDKSHFESSDKFRETYEILKTLFNESIP